MGTERPTSWSPYIAGIVATAAGGSALLLNAVNGLQDDPSGSRTSFLILVLAPLALVGFGFVSAIPRRRRHALLVGMCADDVVVDAIVTPVARARLGLESELKRSYTVALVFSGSECQVWKRGFARPAVCVARLHARSGLRATATKLSLNTVAALAIDQVDGASVDFPLISPKNIVNMPAGTEHVESVIERVVRCAAWSTGHE